MQLALVGGSACEPAPGLRGLCQYCDSDMIAKCGPLKLKQWHWAHKTRVPCDHWWESETVWHREWKNQFPINWRERVRIDPETGEKHIADVRTKHGMVIEFQRSSLALAEVQSREAFYGNMVWIVDGRRAKFDSLYFKMSLGGLISSSPPSYSLAWIGRSKLFHRWHLANKLVFIDFGEPDLWLRIDFNLQTRMGVVAPIGKDDLIQRMINGQPLPRIISY